MPSQLPAYLQLTKMPAISQQGLWTVKTTVGLLFLGTAGMKSLRTEEGSGIITTSGVTDIHLKQEVPGLTLKNSSTVLRERFLGSYTMSEIVAMSIINKQQVKYCVILTGMFHYSIQRILPEGEGVVPYIDHMGVSHCSGYGCQTIQPGTGFLNYEKFV